MIEANENEGAGVPSPTARNAGLQRESSKGRPIGKPWRKGQSGNPSGKRRGTVSLRAAAQRVVSRRDAEQICRKVAAEAKRGNLKAAKLLAELLGDIGAARLTNGQTEAPPEMVVRIIEGVGTQERELEFRP